jgi:hypothetical protein
MRLKPGRRCVEASDGRIEPFCDAPSQLFSGTILALVGGRQASGGEGSVPIRVFEQPGCGGSWASLGLVDTQPSRRLLGR